eukprot:84357_1
MRPTKQIGKGSMAESEKHSKWINLLNLEPSNDNQKFYSMRITSINTQEFIINTLRSDRTSDKKLFRYNIDTNTFNTLSIDDIPSHSSNIDFNNNEQILYVQNETEIISVNMKTCQSNSISGAENGNYFLFINNCFHVFNMHDNHWIGSLQNDSLN